MSKFLELIKANNIKGAYEFLKAKGGVKSYAKEFNNDREIRETQVGKRQDKVTKKEVVKVTKIPIPFQRKIVKSAASFLFGSPVKLVEVRSKEDGQDDKQEAFSAIMDLWDVTRMDSILLKFCQAVKSETEAAIVFYPLKKDGDKDVKIKARLLNSDEGKLYPIFDEFGDMIAFGWEYAVKENDKDVSYLYLFTAENTYAYKMESNEWANVEGYPQSNLFGKIPVVYQSQKYPEWWEVQELIDRFEMSFSKFCDTNDYFAAPKLKAKGHVNSLPSKDETEKVIKLDTVVDGDKIIEAGLDYLTWDHAPESVKLEFETTKGLIYGLSDTPDLSFDNVKGIGNVSGIALKLMFLGSILKSKWDEGDYKVSISRAINIMKAGISNILNKGLSKKMEELRIDINFTSVLPENLKETIEVLTEATGGRAVMSQKTAVANNPLVEDNEEEISNIEGESILDIGETVQ